MPPHQLLGKRIEDLLWGSQSLQAPAWKRTLLWLGRLAYALTRDLSKSQLSLHAMSLVYTTLLSLVPLLAVSFSVLKGFGVHNQIEPLLLNALAPLGDSGGEITRRVIGFVDRMQVGVLGSVGLAMLLYTVIAVIQKIEQAFNYAWRITEMRPLGQRVSHYLSVLLIGPVLFFGAVGVSTSLGSNALVQSLMHSAPLGKLVEVASVLTPYLLISLTFAFVYLFVPNTRVRPSSALVGALFAGLLWQIVGGIFATFMASSTQYTAIYSSLAILVLFMIWVYLGWLILLLGATVAFYHQSPEFLSTRLREIRLSRHQQERLALAIMVRAARRSIDGDPPSQERELARELGLPSSTLAQALRELESRGYLVRTAGLEQPGFVLARTPEGIGIHELIMRMRRSEDDGSGLDGLPAEPVVERVEQAVERAMEGALGGVTLRDLAEGGYERLLSSDRQD